MATLPPRLLITTGEPAGVGPDIVIKIAQDVLPAEIIVIGDEKLLLARAKQLKLPLKLIPFDLTLSPDINDPDTLKIIHTPLAAPCIAGKLDKKNAAYVMRMLEMAHEYAEKKQVDAIVTAPVHKAILNQAGFTFDGHTELFAALAKVDQVVMLFVTPQTKIALATTHLPLSKVAQAITKEHLEKVIRILHAGLVDQFKKQNPTILVCGLNPHAGEQGYLGSEEIEIISPVVKKLQKEKMKLVGPLSADTIFTEKFLDQADAILAMFHDQALPVVKHMGFGKAVNVTLGLPYIRTSVDHGTALDVAGTRQADAGSLKAAILLAWTLVMSS